jgi:hypothetical protein
MIRDRILSELQTSPSGMSLPSLLSTMKIDGGTPNAAAVEAILLLLPDIYFAESRWRTSLKGKVARILSAIEAYASSTGKRIFRAGPALSSLAVDEHPTEDELREVLASSGGRFTLLPNEMIRRNG